LRLRLQRKKGFAVMLDFNYTLLIQFLNILILLVLLRTFLFKPVLNALTRRRLFIQSLAQDIEDEKKHATELERRYEEGAKERKRPIMEQREATVRDAHTASVKVVEVARSELTKELEVLKERVRSESAAALHSLAGEADRLSREITNKVLKRGA
jgi:F-type H+-transporting ATPase subunit b